MMDYLNKKILVAGLGSSGLSMIKFLIMHGAKVSAYDANLKPDTIQSLQQKYEGLTCYTGSLKSALSEGFDALALSPGISERLEEIKSFKQNGGKVFGDIAILANILKHKSDKILAITGSNGKTTVTSLVGYLCQKCGLDTIIAGNIGKPVLEALTERNEKSADVWVLELSSFQLETTDQLNADASVVLNISEDHLERYKNLLDYASTKEKIFNGNGLQILNADDVICKAMLYPNRKSKCFSLDKKNDYWFDQKTKQFKVIDTAISDQDEVLLNGLHNAANILAALALCEAIGLKRSELIKHIKTFKGLPHRLETIGFKNDIEFIDDSKGTNVGATLAAISGLNKKIILIAGGLGKGQDFSLLENILNEKARGVMLIGKDAQKIANDIKNINIPIEFCNTLESAVVKAYSMAKSGDAVLLSPACASFDMFESYAHRAEVFINAFKNLVE